MKKLVTDNELLFERLGTIEFSSDRKRMSTIVRDRKGQVIRFIKKIGTFDLNFLLVLF